MTLTNRTKGIQITGVRILGFASFILLFIFSANAQKDNMAAGKITGRILDSLSGQPIEYATISLVTLNENKVVNGATTDSKGVFKLSNVSEGSYKMLIDFIGYKKTQKTNIVVSKESPVINTGDIKLSSKQTTLNEVIVTGEKSLIENKIDKLVYNADKDISSQTGVAADILKKVPMVSVDVDGNVELQGNANIRFLIDGKPSILYGSSIADVLQSIPASQIQSIEVITSPGARYDAEGTGGIINILLKKNNAHGINGTISLSGGTRLENGSVNLSMRKGKFGANLFFSGNAQLPSNTINSNNRTSKDSTSTSKLLQDGTSKFDRNGLQSGVGFDWDVTPKDNISGTFGYNYFGNDNIGSATRQSILNDASGNQLYNINDMVNTTNKFHNNTYNWSLGYKKKFKKKDQELEIQVNSSNGNILTHYEQTQKFVSPDSIYSSSYGNNPGLENETNIEINYTQPLGEDAVFETGAKGELDHINSQSDIYLLTPSTGNYDLNTNQSTSVDYKRQVYAGYLSFNFKMFSWLNIKAGCRDEYTKAIADYSDAGTVNLKPYNTIVPSLVLAHNFSKKQILKISYSHRIERPDYRDLNPFVNASDPKNISTGNPNLRPEIGDKVEISYSQTFKNGATIIPTMFYRVNKDDIQSYTNYYPTYKIGDSTYTNVAISMRENIGREDNLGLSLFASLPVTKKINFRTNISCFQRYINTGMASGGNIQGFNYRANANASYELSKTLVIELMGNFNSPRINAQGKMPAFTTYNFAFRKQLFNKKGSIAVTATNFLNKYVIQKTELAGNNFTILNERQLPYRSFGFNFTYKFGKMEFRREKEMEDINLTNPPGN